MPKLLTGGFTSFFLKISILMILVSCQEDLVLTTAQYQMPGELSLSNAPSGVSSETSFTVTVSSTKDSFVSYKYKVGLASSTNCTSAAGYIQKQISETLPIDIENLEDGQYVLCVLGIDQNGFEQSLSKAKSVTWTKDTSSAAPIITGNEAFYNLGKSISITVSSPSSDFLYYQYAIISADLECDGAIYSDDISKNTPINDLLLGTSLNGFSSNSSTNNTKLCVKTKDSAGNEAFSSVSWITDFSPPAIQLLNTPDAMNSDNELNVSVSSSSPDFSSIKYAFGWKTNTDCATATYATIDFDDIIDDDLSDFDDGDLKLCVKGLDSRGNESSPTSYEWNMNRYKLSSGTNHACFIDRLGTLRCWGLNTFGQAAGVINDVNLYTPVIVEAGVQYKEVAMFQITTCAITREGVLKCWGYNEGHFGQASPSFSRSPVIIDAGVSYKKVAVGFYHVCAIKESDDQLKCWGRNYDGQLGIGSNSSSISSPVSVDGSTTYRSISAGLSHTCGVTTQGILKCWGSSTYGQAGTPQNVSRNLSPFSMGSNFKEVYSTSSHSCALNSSNEIWCWGRNQYGQIGDGSTNQRSTPVKFGNGYQSAFLQSARTCGIKTNGDMWCSGLNAYYLVSPINFGSSIVSPVASLSNQSLLMGAAGQDSHCALNSDRELLCWGYNSNGLLALGGVSGWLNTPTLVLTPISSNAPTGTVYSADVSINFSISALDQVKGYEVTHYKYKFAGTCADTTPYSSLRLLDDPLVENISSLPDGPIKLCVQAYNENGKATFTKEYNWTKITDGILSSTGAYTNAESIDFGIVEEDGSTFSGTNSPRRSITIRNIGPSTVNGISANLSSTTNFRFAVDPTVDDPYPVPTFPGVYGTCTDSLGSNQTCTIVMDYFPTSGSISSDSATLQLSYTNSSYQTKYFSLNLTGRRAVHGCTNSNYVEYQSYYNIDDNTCSTLKASCSYPYAYNEMNNSCEACSDMSYVYNPNNNSCVSTYCSGAQEYFDSNTYSCVSTDCNYSMTGNTWDSSTGQCVSTCTAANTVWDSSLGSCRCATGTIYSPYGTCVSTDCSWPSVFNYETYACTSCQSGYAYNSSTGQCVDTNCPYGSYWDSTSIQCISNCQGGQSWTGTSCECPYGTTWDGALNSCVSYTGCTGSPDC